MEQIKRTPHDLDSIPIDFLTAPPQQLDLTKPYVIYEDGEVAAGVAVANTAATNTAATNTAATNTAATNTAATNTAATNTAMIQSLVDRITDMHPLLMMILCVDNPALHTAIFGGMMTPMDRDGYREGQSESRYRHQYSMAYMIACHRVAQDYQRPMDFYRLSHVQKVKAFRELFGSDDAAAAGSAMFVSNSVNHALLEWVRCTPYTNDLMGIRTFAHACFRSRIPPTELVRLLTDPVPTGNVYNLHLIRHAFSCRNLITAVKDMGGIAKLSRKVSEREDTLVSNIGIEQALALRQVLKGRGHPYRVVFTSHLRRTLETACIVFAARENVLAMFPEIAENPTMDAMCVELEHPVRRIIPLPFFPETYSSGESIKLMIVPPLEADALRAWTIGALGGFSDLFDFRYLSEYGTGTAFNYMNFLRLADRIMSEEPDALYAAVGHGHAMKVIARTFITDRSALLEDAEERPYNVELWPLTVSCDTGKTVFTGSCILPQHPYRLKKHGSVDPSLEMVYGRRCKFAAAAAAAKMGGRRATVRRVRVPRKKTIKRCRRMNRQDMKKN
jgi:hypothetical protein